MEVAASAGESKADESSQLDNPFRSLGVITVI